MQHSLVMKLLHCSADRRLSALRLSGMGRLFLNPFQSGLLSSERNNLNLGHARNYRDIIIDIISSIVDMSALSKECNLQMKETIKND